MRARTNVRPRFLPCRIYNPYITFRGRWDRCRLFVTQIFAEFRGRSFSFPRVHRHEHVYYPWSRKVRSEIVERHETSGLSRKHGHGFLFKVLLDNSFNQPAQTRSRSGTRRRIYVRVYILFSPRTLASFLPVISVSFAKRAFDALVPSASLEGRLSPISPLPAMSPLSRYHRWT